MSTDEKKLIDVVFGRDATRQTSVINPDASVEGRRYNPEHLQDGGFGVTFTVDLRAMRGKKMTPEQRFSLHRIILRMAMNVLEHDSPVLSVPAADSAALDEHIVPMSPADEDLSPRAELVPAIDRVPEVQQREVKFVFERGFICEEELHLAVDFAIEKEVRILDALQTLKFSLGLLEPACDAASLGVEA